MVHVLREVHTALKPGGILLDIHPMARLRRVEVRHGRRRVPIGDFDDGVDRVRAAQAELRRVVGAGLFEVEVHRRFDMHEVHASVAALRDYERETGFEPMPADLAERARAALHPGAELILVERIRATRLRWLPADAQTSGRSRPG